MTSTQQRAALQRQVWAIVNEGRGAVDAWDFKPYYRELLLSCPKPEEVAA